ncbi:hypothetical protein ACVII0_005050 [Sinorhizobium meliloti]
MVRLTPFNACFWSGVPLPKTTWMFSTLIMRHLRGADGAG